MKEIIGGHAAKTSRVVDYLTELQASVARVEPLITQEAAARLAASFDALPRSHRAVVSSDMMMRALSGRAPQLFAPVASAIALDALTPFFAGSPSLSGAVAALITKAVDPRYGHYTVNDVDRFMGEYHGAGGAKRTLGIDLRPVDGNCAISLEMVATPYFKGFQSVRNAVFAFRFDHPSNPKEFSDVIIGRHADGSWAISGEALAKTGNGNDAPDRPLADATLMSLEALERSLVAFQTTIPVPNAAMLGAGGRSAEASLRNFQETKALLGAVRAAIADKNTEIAKAQASIADYVDATVKPTVGWISADVAGMVAALSGHREEPVATAALGPDATSPSAKATAAHQAIRAALADADLAGLVVGLRALNSNEISRFDAVLGSEVPEINETFAAAAASKILGKDLVLNEMMRRLKLAKVGSDDQGPLLRALEVALAAGEEGLAVQATAIGVAKLNWDTWQDHRGTRHRYFFDQRYAAALVDVVVAAASQPERVINCTVVKRAVDNLSGLRIDAGQLARLEAAHESLLGFATANDGNWSSRDAGKSLQKLTWEYRRA